MLEQILEINFANGRYNIPFLILLIRWFSISTMLFQVSNAREQKKIKYEMMCDKELSECICLFQSIQYMYNTTLYVIVLYMYSFICVIELLMRNMNGLIH